MIRKIFGFTIGEVLIALGVIGIIAMLTIPQIINGRQATEAKSAFNTAYSIISNTITEMDANNVSILPTSYTSTQNSFSDEIIKYQKVVEKCNPQDSSICYTSSEYKQLNGNAMNINFSKSYVLNNGMLIAIQNESGTTNKNGKEIPKPIFIAVDINGKMNPPNRMGIDFFIFELTSEGLMPSGGAGTFYETPTSGTPTDSDCNITAMTGSGKTCAARALAEESYFVTIHKNH